MTGATVVAAGQVPGGLAAGKAVVMTQAAGLLQAHMIDARRNPCGGVMTNATASHRRDVYIRQARGMGAIMTLCTVVLVGHMDHDGGMVKVLCGVAGIAIGIDRDMLLGHARYAYAIVAGITAGRRLLVHGLAVASAASQFLVTTGQGKSRSGVIEGGRNAVADAGFGQCRRRCRDQQQNGQYGKKYIYADTLLYRPAAPDIATKTRPADRAIDLAGPGKSLDSPSVNHNPPHTLGCCVLARSCDARK